MDNIAFLRLEEPVRLDRDQLEVLVLQMGPAGADQVVGQAMEEIAVLLARLERRHRENAADEVATGVRSLVAIAQQVGMTTLARVGRDVLSLIGGPDSNAYCAAFARMIRIGETSLVAVWDLQDMRI
ncbi:MAG TPA: hypothetical protein ENK41_05495 [Rhodobacteraceae bacterium]|nr:hypothetical protein [Paracoccaceae bacterium]